MNTKIRQCGVIESINGTHARIQIVRPSACQTCEASSRCNIHSGKITYDQRLAKYQKGDRVQVEITAKAGRYAVAIGFALPLVLFVSTMLALHYNGATDEIAALSAIGVIGVYYFIIYLIRKYINRHFEVRLAD